MARVRIHVLCGQPAGECGCPPDDPDEAEDSADEEDAA
jgi:hypothetical protein